MAYVKIIGFLFVKKSLKGFIIYGHGGHLTLLTPSFGNHLFAYHLVLKHPPTYKYDIGILLHSKSRKKCHKIFENRFINKNLTLNNHLGLVFYMCKGGYPKILNLEF